MVLVRDIYERSDTPWEVTVLAHPPLDVEYRMPAMFRTIPDLQHAGYGGDELEYHASQLQRQIGRLCRTGDGFDILHCQHLTFGMSLALVRAFPAIPKIALCHGTDLLEAARDPLLAGGMQEVTGAVDAIVVPARALISHVRALIPSLPEERFTVIPWGVPTPKRHLTRTGLKAPRDGLRVLYAGRLDAAKGFPIVLNAMRQCPFVHLSVASPPDQLRRIVESLYPDLCERVTPLGWLPRSTLFREFGRHHCLVVPSLALEAFHLASVEAQAHGLAVVYSRIDCLEETLGGTGLPFEPGDTDALCVALSSLHAAPQLRTELAERGADNARRFDLRTTQRQLANLSRRVVQRHTA